MDESNGPEDLPEGSRKKSSLHQFPGSLGELFEFYKELEDQTARGAAILAASYLDWKLATSIKRRLYQLEVPIQPNSKEKNPRRVGEKLLGKGVQSGDLTYIDKCRLAYCMGLIGPAAYRDLDRIGQIRNKFAHRLTIKGFSTDEQTRQLCDDLETPQIVREIVERVNPNSYEFESDESRCRQMYLNAGNWIVQMLSATSSKEVGWPVPEKGTYYPWGGLHLFW